VWFSALTLAGMTLAVGCAAFRSGGLPQGNLNPSIFIAGLASLASWTAPDRSRVRLARVTLWLLLALPAWASLQLVFSVKPSATLLHVFRIATYAAVFLFAWDLGRRHCGRPWIPVLPIILVALLEAVLGLVQADRGGAVLASGTYPNRNHFAGLLEMALPFALLLPVSILKNSPHRFHSPAKPAILACVLFTFAAALLLGIVYSLSRGGYISALASLFVTGALALGRSGIRKWLPLGLMAVLVILAFVFLPTDQLIARFADIAATDDITADERARLWSETLRLIAAYPVFGCGLGAYESGFYRFKTVAPLSTVDFAHNDYLQILAEFGLIGFLLLAALLIRTLVRVFRATLGDGPQRYLAIACGGSLTAILLHSFVDFNLYIPANAMVLAWIAGVAEALPTPSPELADLWNGRLPRENPA
jgi:O-antigen ligase